MNMTLRMYADEHDLHLDSVATTVSVNRATEAVARFEYHIELMGELDANQKAQLLHSGTKCPVRKTRSRTIDCGCLSSNLPPPDCKRTTLKISIPFP